MKKNAASGEKVKLKNLTAPIKVGRFELKNRMVLAPMNETTSGANGEATDQCQAYYGARAKGGAAMVVTGAVMATRMAADFVWGRNLYCFSPGHIQGLSLLCDRVHYFGALACAQMTMGFGRQGHSADHHRLAPAATAGLPYEIALEYDNPGSAKIMRVNEASRSFLIGQQTYAMSIDEIHDQQKEYSRSCQLASKAGFDGIEIHAPHGYLEHSFLSPLTNKRTDYYGGEWRNRKRLLNEVMEQVRYSCPGAIVGVRISAHEHVEGGLTTEEMVDLALDLQERGADYISLSDGGGYEDTAHLVGSKEVAEHIPDSASKFKKALKIPVIVASQHDPVKADADIGAGKFDISALGRQLFIDPEYPNKVMEGRIGDIKRCTRCNQCLARCLGAELPPACPFNPNLGREYALEEYRIGPRKKSEPFFPPALTGVSVPDLISRPWWKPETPVLEKAWRKFRGPGPHV
jgi:2,4-dienoyl-CoA reductase-like NADH-dependent reductase (Old Yellow Enzyme family)